MKTKFALLALCVLGCSPSGNANQSGQPNGFAGLMAQAMPQPSQPSQPAAAEAPQPPQQAPVHPFGMQPPPMQAPPQPPMQAPPQAPAFDSFQQAEAAPEPPAAAAPTAPAPPVAVAPVQPDPSQADGTAEVCSAMCDRVVACQIATKEACMPACAPQVPQLAPEQRAELIKIMGNMSCEDLTRFGAQGGGTQAGAPQGVEGDDGSDDDGEDQ